jgi:hypothetical protein
MTSIPGFSIHGTLPPFVGEDGPGGNSSDMSPYVTTCCEVVRRFGATRERRAILKDWLNHRSHLRSLGLQGFQWLDGSFVESKDPKDLDVVFFFVRPTQYRGDFEWESFVNENFSMLGTESVKRQFKLDFFPVDLNGSAYGVVQQTRYWFGLFSHRRDDYLWKGMLEVPLMSTADDDEAQLMLSDWPHSTEGDHNGDDR